MQDRTFPKRLTRSRRGRLLAVGALVSGVLVAGCGGGSARRTATTVRAASPPTSSTRNASAATTTAGGGATSSGSTTQSAGASGPLAFAKCMRADGVPNFPDPNPARGGLFSLAGINPSSPAFRAAQAKCQKLMGGGLPIPGSTMHPSTQTMVKLRKIAVCMRQHGVSQFPDPRTTVPSSPAGIQEISDFDGAILLFPATMNVQAPAYKQALTACGAPPLGLPH